MLKKLLIATAALGALAFPSGAGAYVNDDGREVCPDQTFEQAFEQFNDKSFYALVPNGSFEAGLFGWDVTGDAQPLLHPNEFRPDQGTYGLYMPAGSSVTSPPICVSRGYPYARIFLQRLGEASGATGVKVEVLYPPRVEGVQGKSAPSGPKPNGPTNPNAGAGQNNGGGNGNGQPNGGNGGGRPTGGNGNPNGGNGNGNGGGNGSGGQADRPDVKPAGFLQGRSIWRPSRKFSLGQGRIGHGTVQVRFRFTVKGDAGYIIDDLLVDPRCRR